MDTGKPEPPQLNGGKVPLVFTDGRFEVVPVKNYTTDTFDAIIYKQPRS